MAYNIYNVNNIYLIVWLGWSRDETLMIVLLCDCSIIMDNCVIFMALLKESRFTE